MDTFTHTPLLQKTDCVILGGTIAALSAALHAAACGQTVTMVCEDTFLYSDMVKSSCYHLQKHTVKHNPLHAILFPEEIDAQDIECKDLRIIHPDSLKLWAEKLCEKENIEILYKTVPLYIDQLDGQKVVYVAGKFGIGSIKCKTVLDLENPPGNPAINQTGPAQTTGFAMNIMNAPFISEEQVYESRLSDKKPCSIILRPGAYGKGHVLLEIQTNQQTDPSIWEQQTVYKAMILEAFKWVKIHLIGFENIHPGRFAESPYTARLDLDAEITRGFLAAKSAIHGNDVEQTTKNHQYSLQQILLSQEMTCHSSNPTFDYTSYTVVEDATKDLPIDSIHTADIIVVGGGTAGIMAAISAARCNMNVILVEGSHQLGGTSTIGGVHTYWYGRRYTDVQEIDAKINALYEDLNLQRKKGIWTDYDHTNPDLRSLVFSQLCTSLSISVFYNCMAFSVLKKGNRVAGIVTADGRHMRVIVGKCIIDATGDGDTAVYAGAAHSYGGKRDVLTFWASLAQYTSPDEYSNNFSSTVMVSDPFDYTRFIIEGRRRCFNMFDHGTYLAPRESRHICGMKTITLREILAFEEYPDNLYTCFSNYDPKGKSCADIIYAGFLPPPMPMAIPLCALLPVDANQERIPGSIVIGKAISATHDAFPGLRMQTDLMHQGTVVGMAAARVVHENVDFPYIEMDSLQSAITKETGDPLSLAAKSLFDPRDVVDALHTHAKKEWTDLPFTEEINTIPVTISATLMESSSIRELLEKRFSSEQDDKTKLLIAHLLLWHQSDIATDFVLQEIERELTNTRNQGLPERKGSLQCVQMLPDHGVMAETIHSLNLLAWSKKKAIVPIFSEICRRLIHGERNYRSNAKSTFHYIESFAYVAERTLFVEFKPMLKDLVALPEFREACDDSNNRKDILGERLVILLLSLYRALARLGDKQGYEGLVDLLACKTLSIRISACMELQTLTKLQLPIVQKRWSQVISEKTFNPIPIPIVKRIW